MASHHQISAPKIIFNLISVVTFIIFFNFSDARPVRELEGGKGNQFPFPPIAFPPLPRFPFPPGIPQFPFPPGGIPQIPGFPPLPGLPIPFLPPFPFPLPGGPPAVGKPPVAAPVESASSDIADDDHDQVVG